MTTTLGQPRMSEAEISQEIMSVHGKMLDLPWTAAPASTGRDQLSRMISATSRLIYSDEIKAQWNSNSIVHNRYIYSCAFPAVKIMSFCLSRFQPSEAFARQVFDFYFELMMGWSEEREESLTKFNLEPDDLVLACRFMVAKQRNILLDYAALRERGEDAVRSV